MTKTFCDVCGEPLKESFISDSILINGDTHYIEAHVVTSCVINGVTYPSNRTADICLDCIYKALKKHLGEEQ